MTGHPVPAIVVTAVAAFNSTPPPSVSSPSLTTGSRLGPVAAADLPKLDGEDDGVLCISRLLSGLGAVIERPDDVVEGTSRKSPVLAYL